MDVTQHQEGSGVVLRISGKCTVEHAAALRDALLAAVSTNQAVSLDISGVEEADVTFLQLLLSAAQTLERSGRKLLRHGEVAPAAQSAARVSGFAQSPKLTTFFNDEGRDG